MLEKIHRLRQYINPVSSTNVSKIKWDSVTKELVVRFESGDTYTYDNVPEAVYNNIVDGEAGTIKGKYPSVGAAVHQYLIQGGYQYRKGGTI